jgi:hypothetical protein
MFFHQDDALILRTNDQATVPYVQDEADQTCFSIDFIKAFDGHAFSVVDAIAELEVAKGCANILEPNNILNLGMLGVAETAQAGKISCPHSEKEILQAIAKVRN